MEKQARRTSPKKDGWYSWMVASAAFVSLFFGVGFSFGSIGVITVGFGKKFPEATEDDLAWIGSLRACFLYMGGLVASALVEKIGCRSMTIIGGVLAAVGLGTGCMAEELWAVYLTVGVICGLGVSCILTSASIVTNGYFVKWRHAAFAFVYLGDNIGAGTFGVATQSLLDKYDLPNTLIALSGFMAAHVVCAIFFEPPERETGTAEIPVEGHFVKSGEPSDDLVEMCNIVIAKTSTLDADGRGDHSEPPENSAAAVAMADVAESSANGSDRPRPTAGTSDPSTLEKLRFLLRQWKVWLLLVTMFSWEYTDAAYLSLLPLHAQNVNLTESEGALGVTLLGVGGALGNTALIPLATRAYNHVALYAFSCLISGSVGMLYPVSSTVYAYCTLSVLFGIFQGMVIALTMSVATAFADDVHLAILFGLTTVACGLGGLAGPVATGYLLELVGDVAALVLSGALSAAMFFVMVPVLTDVRTLKQRAMAMVSCCVKEKLMALKRAKLPATPTTTP